MIAWAPAGQNRLTQVIKAFIFCNGVLGLVTACPDGEGAMQAGSTAVHRSNPGDLSRAQREAIARRVLKGEKIIL